jgi:D-sedoheptulose 7-phosphate isomerase
MFPLTASGWSRGQVNDGAEQDCRAIEVVGTLEQRRVAHNDLLTALMTPSSAGAIERSAELIAESLGNGGKAIFFGNGGSAADAEHIAAELVGRFRLDRRPLAALSLGSNSAVASALANDFAFDQAFARELEALAKPGDVAIAITTSGCSQNVLAALDQARSMGVSTVALTGLGHQLGHLADSWIVVETSETALVQEMHAVIGHVICEIVERRMGFDS